MAHVVGEFPASPRRKYPWDEWLDGQTRLLVPGEDFDLDMGYMRTTVYGAARRHGVRVRVAARDEGLYVKAVTRDGDDL